MARAIDVAQCIFTEYKSISGKTIDEMKLHKLLYLSQRESIAITNEPMFKENFEGWKYGPVCREVRNSYTEDGMFADDIREVSDEERYIVKNIILQYGAYESWKLSELSHKEISWKNAPDGKIVKTDVSIAKNYLEKEELAELNEIVTMYLDYATRQARRHIPMTMEDWKTKLDAFLRFNDADVLQDKGKVTAAIAKEFAESEFERYRVIQDSLYESDFDKLMNDMEKNGITY